jgi:signal transduction histidine kinase
VAREIHDTLGHSLTVMHVQLEAARAMLGRDPERALAAIARAQGIAEEGLAEVRRSVAMLRASPLEGRPLASAIARLVEDARATGLEARLAVEGEARPLAPPKEFALYRAAQEALTNVRKHARARRVEVRLAYGGEVMLEIADDGEGTQPEGDRTGFGLLGLRERVALVGGTVSVESRPGRGFRLAVELPP